MTKFSDIVTPAILEHSYDAIEGRAHLVKNLVPLVQIDIVDGLFAPSITWPYRSAGRIHDRHFDQLSHEQEGLPFWDSLDYELDLMIRHPEDYIDQWLALGPKRVILHLAALRDAQAALEHFQTIREYVEVYIALSREHTPSDIADFIPLIDGIQCMGIARIGYQGQPFDETVLDQIKSLRASYPDLRISVDGGVTTATIQDLQDAGADRFVAGSAVFGHPDTQEAIQDLVDMLE